METKFPRGAGGFIKPEFVIKEFGILLEMKIADFGCGHGYFSIPLAKAAGDNGIVYAIDIQNSALGAVRSMAKKEGLLNIKYIKGDLEKEKGSRLPDDSMDLVLLANILHQSPGKSEILKEATRVLKKQGSLIMVDWSEDSFVGPPRRTRISRETAKRLAESEGFRIIREFSAGEYHYGLTMAKLT